MRTKRYRIRTTVLGLPTKPHAQNENRFMFLLPKRKKKKKWQKTDLTNWRRGPLWYHARISRFQKQNMSKAYYSNSDFSIFLTSAFFFSYENWNCARVPDWRQSEDRGGFIVKSNFFFFFCIRFVRSDVCIPDGTVRHTTDFQCTLLRKTERRRSL